MKKACKLLTIVLMVFLLFGCNKDPVDTPNPTPENENKLNTQVRAKKTIVVTGENTQVDVATPFSIVGYNESYSPALTYDNNSKDEEKVNVNISSDLGLMLYYQKNDEKITKIAISDMKIESNPKKGTLKFYATNKGNKDNLVTNMRENPISGEYVYESDINENKLENGDMTLSFSTTLEQVVKTSFEISNGKKYTELLQALNVKNEELQYKISFVLTIHTDKYVYGLPIEYSNDKLDIYGEKVFNVVRYEKPIYFEIIETK